MADIRLFRIAETGVTELDGRFSKVERTLQTLIETRLEAFLGVRFVASEHATGERHGGRIDTLGLDENHCPVIIEYKRAMNQSVISQGLFYLSWLLDHKADFERLTQDRLGAEVAHRTDWSSPRVLCIAGDFTNYDEHAVQQIGRNIELIRYRQYGTDLLLLEAVNAPSRPTARRPAVDMPSASSPGVASGATVDDHLGAASAETRQMFDGLCAFVLGLGDDVHMKVTKSYIGFWRRGVFASVRVRRKAGTLVVHAQLDADGVELTEGFVRDARDIPGNSRGVVITIRTAADLDTALPMLERSYEEA